ncbi:Ultraviolet-b receptor uvr8 [Thalictrum thalictroides]|uniref:Ultraviolet-b receptor uvr8 n=1 Tax=Thalictrum thalictroides TaxID=46969 RepID=A0A7J6X4W5_THATH|nr:Ultraviolet-b receptor uvr8 [Thalictrum thalictroides]
MSEDYGGDVKMEEGSKERLVLMWGYLPGISNQRSPLVSPEVVKLPGSIGVGNDSWKDVSGGGCGFAMAISESGKLITWGSTDDMGLSYVTSGKHGEIPEPFPLQTDASIVQAAAGWAHCVAVTDGGDVYTWGWKECVPTGKVVGGHSAEGGSGSENDTLERHNSLLTEQGSPQSQVSRSSVYLSGFDSKGGAEENTKRRRISSSKHAAESSTSGDETQAALPCLVTLNPGIRIAAVAAGGRHTLALSDLEDEITSQDSDALLFTGVSDVGQVWGWGYGGEGQLGLGSRIRVVSTPHLVPCLESPSYGKDRISAASRGNVISEGQNCKAHGSYVKGIACGGRHSAVVTDTGALLTFGWGLYGQCGQGSTDDELSPTCVSSLLGIQIEGVATGLWHTVCISTEGDVYAFGGNQFGQLGTGAEQAETLPRVLEAPSMEDKNAKVVSCGARHTAVITDDGNVFCWGWNKYGQLGLGDVIDRNVPCQVAMDGCLPKNVACGWWHTLVLADLLT